MADKIREWLVAKYPDTGKKCESPIEQLYYSAQAFTRASNTFALADKYHYEQQVAIGPYKVDFLYSILSHDDKQVSLVVEMDGHEFHEKTKEQATKDKMRDRYMVERGYQIMRYTGAEVWANPFACVEQVVNYCYVIRYGKTQAKSKAQAHLDAIAAFLKEG